MNNVFGLGAIRKDGKDSVYYHKSSDAYFKVVKKTPKEVTLKAIKITSKTPKYIKLGTISITGQTNLKTFFEKV